MLIIPKTALVSVLIYYWRPDYVNILQSFFWQTNDEVPKLPRVHKFIHFWKTDIQAIIQDVEISEGNAEFRHCDLEKFFQSL